jgi:hypothetical protein
LQMIHYLQHRKTLVRIYQHYALEKRQCEIYLILVVSPMVSL